MQLSELTVTFSVCVVLTRWLLAHCVTSFLGSARPPCHSFATYEVSKSPRGVRASSNTFVQIGAANHPNRHTCGDVVGKRHALPKRSQGLWVSGIVP